MTIKMITGDCRDVLKTLPTESVHCVVCSPPYWGLRDYGTAKWEGGDAACDHSAIRRNHNGEKQETSAGTSRDRIVGDDCHRCGAIRIDSQIGLEPDFRDYVTTMVEVFREVKRVLRSDGVCWINLGDSYASGGRGGGANGSKQQTNVGSLLGSKSAPDGLKPKDLCGIPWRVAQALQAPYYTGSIKSERDRVWLAATLEAEGTICGFTHQRKDNGDIRRGVHIAITNSNTRMLDECYRIWPTSRHDHNPHGKGHLGKLDTFRWIAHGVEEKANLLAELYPYMICKKSQALLAWYFFQISAQARGRNKGDEGDRNRERCAWIVHALSRLNRLESVDLPAWLQEPASMYEQGWYLRQDIIWSKPSPMPESVTDRCTKAHEYLFLLAKSGRYYYDAEAIKEQAAPYRSTNYEYTEPAASGGLRGAGGFKDWRPDNGRNKRSVWTVPTAPYSEAHFATFPPALIEPCIKAGTSEKGCCAKCGAPWVRIVEKGALRPTSDRGTQEYNPIKSDISGLAMASNRNRDGHKPGMAFDHNTIDWHPTCLCVGDNPNVGVIPCTVLDPFAGAGTTGLVADRLQRSAILIELNPDYSAMSERRIVGDAPLFVEIVQPDAYNATDDFTKSIEEAYALIRRRKAAGGEGWEPK